jgi:hypothetical protein
MRRGRPGKLLYILDLTTTQLPLLVAHLLYGVPSTINCANYVYFLAMEKCYEMGRPEAVRIFLGITKSLAPYAC